MYLLPSITTHVSANTTDDSVLVVLYVVTGIASHVNQIAKPNKKLISSKWVP